MSLGVLPLEDRIDAWIAGLSPIEAQRQRTVRGKIEMKIDRGASARFFREPLTI